MTLLFFVSLIGLSLLIAIGLFFGGDAPASHSNPEAVIEPAKASLARAFAQEDLIEGWIAVDFVDGTSKARFDELEKTWGIDVEFNSVASHVISLTIGKVGAQTPEALDALLAEIRAHPEVEHAEPLFRYAANFAPNDPLFDRQWNFEMVGLRQAWDVSRGKGVTVAVIDTGIAFEDRGEFRALPDLKGARFAPGYDFVNDDEHANDDHGHGSHVAGTIAQRTDNGEGVAGIAFEATLMPLKVLDANGMGNSVDIAEAIRWATDHGARVLNLSLGGGAYSQIMSDAVAYAAGKGALVVCAAGNAGRPKVEYPAAYPGALAVSAVGPSGKLAGYSSFGPEVALAAPGGDIRASGVVEHGILQNTIKPEAVGESHYAYFQGTSMAAPHVAGVAALLFAAGASDARAVRQALLQGAQSPERLVDRQMTTPLLASAQSSSSNEPIEASSASTLSAGRDIRYGHGILDAVGALEALGVPLSRSLPARVAALLLALALLVFARLTISKAAREAHPIGLTCLTGVLIASLGLFFLPWIGASGSLSRLALPMVRWPSPLMGSVGMSALFASALVPFILGFLTHAGNCPSLRKGVIGLALGFSGALLIEFFSGAKLALLPWAPLSALWFLVNAALAFLLARALMLTPEGGRR
jgi:serine protease